MPEIATLKNSKFLGKEDCPSPILLTFASPSVVHENVAMEGHPQEMKWCGRFLETQKMMVFNTTNLELAALATGQTNTDNWPGKKIVVFIDPTVQMGGKLVGGIRIRAPRNQPAAPAPAPAPTALPAEPAGGAEEDDVPF